MVPFHLLIICFLSSIFFIIEVVIIIDWYFVYVLLFIYFFQVYYFICHQNFLQLIAYSQACQGVPQIMRHSQGGTTPKPKLSMFWCFMERWPGYADVGPPGCGPDRQSLRFTNGLFLFLKISFHIRPRSCVFLKNAIIFADFFLWFTNKAVKMYYAWTRSTDWFLKSVIKILVCPAVVEFLIKTCKIWFWILSIITQKPQGQLKFNVILEFLRQFASGCLPFQKKIKNAHHFEMAHKTCSILVWHAGHII